VNLASANDELIIGDRRIRVALIARYDAAGADGVARAAGNCARVLPSYNVEAELWNFTSSVESVVETNAGGYRVFSLPCHRNRLLGFFHLPSATQQFLLQHARSVDLLHLHSVFRPENHCVARLGIPYVLTPHNGYHPRLLRQRSRLKKWLASTLSERAYVNRARCVLALNSMEFQDLRDYGITARLAAVPNPLDPDLLLQAKTPIPLGSTWAFLGRLDVDVKGLDLLLEGFKRFRSTLSGSTAKLCVAGTDVRNGRKRLKRLANTLGIQDVVSFPGPKFHHDKAEFLREARVFLHPSRAEGLPFAVLEAMAFGRPVLITEHTYLADVVQAHGAGWVVKPTSSSICEGLEKIAATPLSELEIMGKQARMLIQTKFDWRPVAHTLSSVYREAVR
jgi:glycosyltransferase involved in cell wall biosynthesis